MRRQHSIYRRRDWVPIVVFLVSAAAFAWALAIVVLYMTGSRF